MNNPDDGLGDRMRPAFDPMTMFDVAVRDAPGRTSGRPGGDVVACRRRFDAAFGRTGIDVGASDAVAANRLLLDAFAGSGPLDLPRFVRAHGRAARMRVRRIERLVRPDPDPRAYAAAGAFARACVLLRLIEPGRADDGEPLFRPRDRRRQFEPRGRGSVRGRGPTSAERDRRDRTARANARRVETLDRKARNAASPGNARMVDTLVQGDRRLLAPRSWHGEGFLPEEVVGHGPMATAAFIVGYHRAAFDRRRLTAWQACLARAVREVTGPFRDARRRTPAGSEPLPLADLEALLALGPLREPSPPDPAPRPAAGTDARSGDRAGAPGGGGDATPGSPRHLGAYAEGRVR